MSPTAAHLLDKLHHVRLVGEGKWSARCPGHEDERSSLVVAEGDDGRALAHCHAGCTVNSIVAAIGLTVADLFPPRNGKHRARPQCESSRTIIATYDYVDERSHLIFQVCRFAPKDFRQRRPDGADGWTWRLDDVRRVLYRLPALLAADPVTTVWIVEGEEDVHALERLGLLATTNPGGAGKWRPEYSKVLRGRCVVVLPDHDAPGRRHAESVAASLHDVVASVRVVELPGLHEHGDVRDWLAGGGTRDALEALISAPPVAERQAPASSDPLVEILDAVETFVAQYVVLPKHASVAVALWVAHAHALEAFDVTPYLAVTSPEKRSGKTRLLEVLELLVPRPWRVVRPSEAVLFRKIERDQPTLLLDETDAIFRERSESAEGLRGVLNAANRRGAVVPRCVGKNLELRDFATFCPKVLAGIGDLPDTVTDRSIGIRMQRRTATERASRFRTKDAADHATPLREALAAWASGAIPSLQEASPVVPDELNDRAGDAWEPLCAVADLAGGEWPARARLAARALHAAEPTAESSGLALLRAIQTTFTETGTDRILTGDLLRALVARDGEPWGAWWGAAVDKDDTRGPGFKLAKLLKPFGLASKDIRTAAGRGKGFELPDFTEAFARYLSPPPNDVTTRQPLGDKAVRAETRRDVREDVTSSNAAETLGGEGLSRCHVVESGEEHVTPESESEVWL